MDGLIAKSYLPGNLWMYLNKEIERSLFICGHLIYISNDIKLRIYCSTQQLEKVI